MSKFQIARRKQTDGSTEFRARFIGGNNEIVWQTENYERVVDAYRAVELVEEFFQHLLEKYGVMEHVIEEVTE